MAQVTRFFTLFVVLLTLTIIPAPAVAEGTVATGRCIVEPPTLQCAGFEWYIDGDDNRTASVAVSYREQGTSEWLDGLPLLRLQYERRCLELGQKLGDIKPTTLDLRPGWAEVFAEFGAVGFETTDERDVSGLTG